MNPNSGSLRRFLEESPFPDYLERAVLSEFSGGIRKIHLRSRRRVRSCALLSGLHRGARNLPGAARKSGAAGGMARYAGARGRLLPDGRWIHRSPRLRLHARRCPGSRSLSCRENRACWRGEGACPRRADPAGGAPSPDSFSGGRAGQDSATPLRAAHLLLDDALFRRSGLEGAVRTGAGTRHSPLHPSGRGGRSAASAEPESGLDLELRLHRRPDRPARDQHPYARVLLHRAERIHVHLSARAQKQGVRAACRPRLALPELHRRSAPQSGPGGKSRERSRRLRHPPRLVRTGAGGRDSARIGGAGRRAGSAGAGSLLPLVCRPVHGIRQAASDLCGKRSAGGTALRT